MSPNHSYGTAAKEYSPQAEAAEQRKNVAHGVSRGVRSIKQTSPGRGERNRHITHRAEMKLTHV